MSDEQHTSWRDRFFGTAPAETPESSDAHDAEPQHSAELAPDSAEVAATSVEEHDAHQPLVEHVREPEAETAAIGSPVTDDRADSPIEPTVISPSTLRGPSHSAAHPDDSGRSAAAGGHGEAATTSLSREPEEGAAEPPELVEPRRPAFRLRRQADGEHGSDETVDDGREPAVTGAAAGAGAGMAAAGAAGGAAAGAGAAGGAGATALGRSRDRTRREFVEPEPTQAMPTQAHDDEATRAIDTQEPGIREPGIREPGTGESGTGESDTRALPEQAAAEERTRRFGIIRDEVPASSIAVDDETARRAAGGTPIVLVEEPVPPRRRGARGVGFAVALLATLIFALLFAAAFFAVGYLFERGFDATETLEGLWLRPSYLLPVIVFFVAYLLVALIVNRAGWWAHVLGAFLVALFVYAAHIGGAFMESEGGWESYTQLLAISARDLSPLVLAPLAVLAFVLAREVPIWVGGIVARRGRRAREWNRQAMEDFNAENAERLAAYERARG